jgi:cyclophilin family peptidyl-prolyl cis-trans isomerase
MCCVYLLAGLAVLQPGSAYAQADANANAKVGTDAVTVAAFSGDASAVGADGAEIPLAVGETIALGSVVTTGADGKVGLSFGPNAAAIDRSNDLMLLGPETAVELKPLPAGGAVPFGANVRKGVFRVVLRSGPEAAAPVTRTGERVITLSEGDMLVTFDPDSDDATYMLRSGELRIEAGQRKIRLLSRMQRTVVGGRIRAATRIASDEWKRQSMQTEIEGLDLTPSVRSRTKTDAEGKAAEQKTQEQKTPATRPAKPAKPAKTNTKPAPWEYNAETNKYWNPEHGHWHNGKPPADKVAAAAEAASDAASGAASDLVFVRMSTTQGDIILELDRGRAPITVANFLTYVEGGFYSDTVFHRLMANFMIQGGGFDTKGNKKPTRAGITNEWRNGLKNARGTISMARVGGNPDSGTSQFFINVVDNRGLDQQQRDGAAYAVFGRVVGGMDVVDAIRQLPVTAGPRGERSKPVDPPVIKEVVVITAEEAAGG